MITIERNRSNDIFLNASGQFQLCDGKLCKAQILEAAILTVLGELQFDVNTGIPYFSTVFENHSKIDLWAKHVSIRVRQFPWVNLISKFTYSFDTERNMLEYTMDVLVDEDIITIGNVTQNTGISIPNGSSGDNGMESLIDSNGNFYLPVFKISGIQYFRKMESIEDAYGPTIKLSEYLYIKDENNTFVVSNP
jgi:hypothetical protein